MPSPPPRVEYASSQSRFARAVPWLIVALALGLRLGYVAEVAGTPAFQVPVADAGAYHDSGTRIAQGHLITEPRSFFLGPLYSYYLGAVYALAGVRPWVAVALQCVLAACTVWLAIGIGRCLLSARAGLLAGAGLAVLGPAVYFSSLLLMETLIAFLNAAALYLAVRERPPGRAQLLLCGAALGLAGTGRPSELALVVPIGIHAALRAGPARRFAWVLVGTLILVAPATLHNWMVERDLVVVTSSGGFNFYVGNGPGANGTSHSLDDVAATSEGVRNYAMRETGRAMKSSEVSRWWFARAVGHIGEHPAQAARLLLRKLVFFWSALDLPQIEWFTYDRGRSPLLKLLPTYAVLGPLALLGFVVTLPRWRRVWVLHAALAVYVVSIALFFVTARYRVAALPMLCVLAGAFADWLVRALRAREGRRLAAAAVLASVCVYGLGAWHYPVDPTYTLSQQHVRASRLASGQGDRPAARCELEQAIALYPGNWDAHASLGVLEQEDGRYERSVQELSVAASLNPGGPDIRYSLGVSLFKQGAVEAARAAMAEAIALDPYSAKAAEYAGVIDAARDRAAEAERQFRHALELDPARASAHNNLGTLLGSLGRHDEARGHFQAAVDSDPDYLPARRNLALLWIASGQLLRAQHELDEVLARAPGDTFALRWRVRLAGGREVS